MIAAPILSALHLLTLALGLGAIVWRFRACRRVSSGQRMGRGPARRRGVGNAAGLWMATGLARVFAGGRETTFYTHKGLVLAQDDPLCGRLPGPPSYPPELFSSNKVRPSAAQA